MNLLEKFAKFFYNKGYMGPISVIGLKRHILTKGRGHSKFYFF